MFQFAREQKVDAIAGAKVGGQPGANPPLLIASMFHNKDRILTDRKGNFDRPRATELIRQQEALTASTGIPYAFEYALKCLDIEAKYRKGETWEYLPAPKFDHGVF